MDTLVAPLPSAEAAYSSGFAAGIRYGAQAACRCVGDQRDIDRILRYGPKGLEVRFFEGVRDGVARISSGY
jgi:hypothetical protein